MLVPLPAPWLHNHPPGKIVQNSYPSRPELRLTILENLLAFDGQVVRFLGSQSLLATPRASVVTMDENRVEAVSRAPTIVKSEPVDLQSAQIRKRSPSSTPRTALS